MFTCWPVIGSPRQRRFLRSKPYVLRRVMSDETLAAEEQRRGLARLPCKYQVIPGVSPCIGCDWVLMTRFSLLQYVGDIPATVCALGN